MQTRPATVSIYTDRQDVDAPGWRRLQALIDEGGSKRTHDLKPFVGPSGPSAGDRHAAAERIASLISVKPCSPGFVYRAWRPGSPLCPIEGQRAAGSDPARKEQQDPVGTVAAVDPQPGTSATNQKRLPRAIQRPDVVIVVLGWEGIYASAAR